MLDLNGEYITPKLQRYIQDDIHLNHFIEYMTYDEEILKSKNGNAFFITESNWLSARLLNNNTDKVIYSDIILDTDNIFDFFKDKDSLMKYVFEHETPV